MNEILLLKLVLVPALIAGVTLAGRRWGPAVAGWLSAFPVVAGPILIFMAIEQGPAFAANAAAGTLSAVQAILAFGIAYAWAATRCGWLLSLSAAFMGYACAVACLSLGSPALWVSMPAVALALWVAPRLYPSSRASPAALPAKPGGDMALRMLAGAVLVLAVTHFASTIGPHLSGVFAMFPVMGSVLAVFSHRSAGAGFVIQLLKGMVLGYYAFAVFCIVLSMMLTRTGAGTAFASAFAAALLVQALTRLLLQHRPAHAPHDQLVPATAKP